MLKRPAFRHDPGLSDDVNRAALSVVFNIAEGFLRRRDKETMQFLRYAIASNGELKAGYYVAEGRAYLMPAETAVLIQLNESIARMLRRWSATLGDKGGPRTDIGLRTDQSTRDQGQRYIHQKNASGSPDTASRGVRVESLI